MNDILDFKNPVRGWHFTADPHKFAHGGRTIPEDNRWLVVPKPVSICNYGLHFSKRPIDSLQYAPGQFVFLVEAAGVSESDNKCVARARRIVSRADATSVLRTFARSCASDVLHLWEAPQVVRNYLATGDETIRAAAGAAAWAAAWDAAWDAKNIKLEKMLMEIVK